MLDAMYFPEQQHLSINYIETTTGVRVCRNAILHQAQLVQMPGGKSIITDRVILHADYAPIKINRYCFIDHDTVLKPPSLNDKHIPQTIGKNTYIGDNCLIEAASIGRGCQISPRCVLSPRCILKDFVHVETDTVIPADMVVPPFCVVAGNPARIVGEVPGSFLSLAELVAKTRYAMFILS